MATGQPVVFLHIGAFKTGTTFLQQILWHNREALAADGVLFPGERRWVEQGHAVRDVLQQQKWAGDESRTEGAWARLVDTVRGWPGRSAVISMERLSTATAEQAATIVGSLEPLEVRVVLTARDLGRVIPASWQAMARHGTRLRWSGFLSEIATSATDYDEEGFWWRQDLPGILHRWGTAVPPERISVVTVPPPGTPAARLWERFAAAVDLDPDRYDPSTPVSNASLGAASAELLRRLNPRVADQVPGPVYQRAISLQLGRVVLVNRPDEPKISFEPDQLTWVSDRAEAMVAALRADGYPVIGDLDDLRPHPPVEGVSPDAVGARQLLDAALDALSGLVDKLAENRTAMNRLRTRNRRLRRSLRRTKRQLARRPPPAPPPWPRRLRRRLARRAG